MVTFAFNIDFLKNFFLAGKSSVAIRLTGWGYVIVLTLLALTSSAQPQKDIQFHHFSEEHGLPLSWYESILQDKKGYMWFGLAWGGLIKYDGYTFTTYEFDPFNKNSLGTPNARSLCNDIHGNIWIAGDGGVSKYDPYNNYFIPYWYDWYGPEHKSELHDSSYIAALPTAFITYVTADKHGRVWIGTGKGLCYLDSPSAKVVNLSDIISPDTLCNLGITCLMIDHKGLLWIGTDNGINIYDRVNKKIKLFNPADKNYASVSKKIACLLEDHSGNIWIGLSNTGIYRYDPSAGNSKIYHHSGDYNSLPSDQVKSLFEDSHHKIWVAMYGGLSVYQPATDNFRSYRNNPNDKTSLGSNQVVNLFEDRSGALWIATNGNGVDVYCPTGKNFSFYPYRDKDQASHVTTGIYKDYSGRIYMTTFGSGIQEFDPATGNFKSYRAFPHHELSALNYYFGAYADSDGNFWLLGLHEGLHKFDRNTGKFATIYSTSGDNVSSCMTEDLDKRLWIGTNGGLRCYDLKTKKYSTAKEFFPSTPELDFAGGIGNLYCDKDGVLWIAGVGGLVLLNTKTGKGRSFVQDTENPHSISSNGIDCFYDDGKGKVWIGTTWGLDRFDKKTDQFVSYTVKDGLPDNEVSGILPDDNGNLWLSTSKGLCKFTPPLSENMKPVCRNYNKSDGLPSDGIGHGLKGNNGTFYFGCKAGIVAFKPDELKDNPYVPPVVITDFSVFNKSVEASDSTSILKLPVDETKEIKLSYKQNVFAFSFTALNYIHPEKNKYAYKLEGFDKDWRYTDATKRFANYTNIDPEEYTFRVRASNNDGLWNEKGTSIKLIITPPYWQTLWFKLLCVFAGGMILYTIYYYRMQKIRDIRRIRNKIASDLHDDLGATLSSISIMSELVNQQVKDQSPQASSLLEKIGTSSRNMIEAVNDMVWAINPKNDSFENIFKRMRTFASEILAAKDIAFHFDFDKNLVQSKLKMDMRRNFYLFFKEAVNNTAKYSGAANTHVMIWNRENNLKMTIRDDGSGFEMNTVKAGNGLLNMQRRAEIMKARFNLESIPGKGTTIELEFRNE